MDENVELPRSTATYAAHEPGTITTVVAPSASQGESGKRDPSETHEEPLDTRKAPMRPHLHLKVHALGLNRSCTLEGSLSSQDSDIINRATSGGAAR